VLEDDLSKCMIDLYVYKGYRYFDTYDLEDVGLGDFRNFIWY
jgi:hypothetical protein